jgi:uncharacterized repeat protein (TIGR02543 family)
MKEKRKKLERKLLSFLLTLAMVIGLMPGMSLTVLADDEWKTVAFSDIEDGDAVIVTMRKSDGTYGLYNGNGTGSAPSAVKLTASDGVLTGSDTDLAGCTWTVVRNDDDTVSFRIGDSKLYCTNINNGVRVGDNNNNKFIIEQDYLYNTATSRYVGVYNSQDWRCYTSINSNIKNQTLEFWRKESAAPVPVDITGVTLNPSAAQTIDVDGKVSFTATVAPDGATDKTVKWSVGGTNAGAVKLYSDENCTTEVGADATETLTVYAKGITAGSATVTATSNADSTKSASCDVTVNAQTPADTYIVAGSEGGIFDSVWSGTSEANKMTLAADGTYTKSYEVNQAYSDVQLKVVKNGQDWIGDENGNNVTFNLTGAGTFTVAYNPTTGVVSVSGDIVAVPAETVYYLWGSMTSYSYSDTSYPFSASETDGVYSITNLSLTAGAAFKVMDNNSSIYPEGDTDTYSIDTDGTYNIYFRSDGLGGEGWYEGCIKVEAAAPAATYVVAGSNADIFGTAWDASNENNTLSLAVDGTYQKTYTVSQAYDDINLKVVKNYSWVESYGDAQGNNVIFSLPSAGSFTVIFNPATGVVSVTVDGAEQAHTHNDITFTAWTATDSMPTEAGNYYLANDVTISSTWAVPEGTTNLCLNGHGIIMNGTNRVITVASERTLNLYDCGTEAVHKFTVTDPSDGGAGLATVNDSLESGYQTFTGGYITGGQGGQGGGVYIAGGTLNMHGGNIIGNHAQGSLYFDGGGVALSENTNSQFVMTGGAIQYNTSVGRGGGVGIQKKATVELSGDAKIMYNSCNDWGGGISSFGTLNISGNVRISNNKGGSGLHPQQGSITISGAPVIFDNEGLANILSDVMIDVTGTLTEGAKLGVYWNDVKVFTNSTDTSLNDVSKFVSDNPDYSVMKNADGQLYLEAIYTVTFNAGGHGTAPAAQTVASGSQLTKPTDPTAEGYTFDGWYKEEDLTNEWDFESDTVTGNITLYAKWRQAISYTVTFKVVNGSWNDETSADKTVTLTGYEGDTLKLAANQIPAVGSKPGATYKAEGSWNVTPNVNTAITAATTYVYTYEEKDAPSEAVAPCVTAWTSDAIYVEAVSGQEYVIVLKGQTPDWTGAVTTTAEYHEFDGLTPATEYDIYTRVKETDSTFASEAKKTEVLTSLNGWETQGDAKTGETITIIPDPEDAQGLTWQWYYAEVNEQESVVKGEAIEGETSSSYVVKEGDVGKYLYYVISKGGKELENGYVGPVRIAIHPTVSLEGWAYGENPNTPVVTGNTGNGSVSFTYVEKESEEPESETVPTMPGNYVVYAYVEESGDYAYGFAEAEFAIVKASVTAPTIASKTYNGEVQTAGVQTSNLYTVTTNAGGTNVGEYDVVLTLADPTNYKWTESDEVTKTLTFKITKAAAPTVTVPTPEVVTYDPTKTLANVELSDGWTWVTATTVPTVVNEGYAAALTVDDANYDYAEVEGYSAATHKVTRTVALTVNKADGTAATVNPVNRTYDGTSKALVSVTGEAVGGEMKYVLGENGITAPTEGWGSSIPTATDAGTYYVWYKVKGDGNHNDTDANCVEVSIGKRSVTLTSATASKTYDGTALKNSDVTVSGDGFVTGEGATYSVTGSQKVAGSSANAFTYTFNTGTKESNYNITKTEGTLTVTSRDAKYQISPQANSDELKYDGQSHEVTGFETDTFIVEGNTYTVSGLTAVGSGTDVGSYTVSVSGTAVVKDSDGNDVSDQFAVTPQTGTLTINKRRVTMTSATDTKEYDGDAFTNTEITVTGDGFITGEGADYDVTGTRTLVGVLENTFTYTLKDNTKADNYDITTSYGTLTVNNRNAKYEVTLKANSGKEKYDGTSKAVSGYTIDGNAGEGTGESVVTSFTASNGKTYTVTGMSAEVTGTNAGEYAVNVIGTPIVKDADGNDVTAQFAVSSESGKLTIDKRRVTLTSATDTKVYDGKALSNDKITVSEDGFAEGEGATYDVTGSQTLAGVSANAFTYALSDGTIAGNYDITTVEGKLIVTKSDPSVEENLTVTKSDSSGEVTAVSGLVYDGKAKALVTAGKTEGGTLMYAIGTEGKWQSEIPKATDAGTYKIYYYIKGDDNHKDDGSEKEPKGSVETTIKKAAQDKLTETFAVAEASDDKKADGKISGLDKAKTYQYSADDGKTWTDVKAGSTEIVVKSGTYQIRYAEDKNHEAGKAASVTVTAKAAPSPEPEPEPEPAKTNAIINLKSVTQKNNKVQVRWTKVNEADGYDVYINYCGSKAEEAAKTIEGNSTTSASFDKIEGKKINQKKNIRVMVYAYKMVNGKKVILAKTIIAHLAGTKSVKYTNPKALKLTKSAYQIKVKKTAQIEAKVTLENSSKMLLPESHVANFRYKSSNTKIATVNKNGKITGKSKGTCYIYVYTVNGLMKKVKVTVK